MKQFLFYKYHSIRLDLSSRFLIENDWTINARNDFFPSNTLIQQSVFIFDKLLLFFGADAMIYDGVERKCK